MSRGDVGISNTNLTNILSAERIIQQPRASATDNDISIPFTKAKTLRDILDGIDKQDDNAMPEPARSRILSASQDTGSAANPAVVNSVEYNKFMKRGAQLNLNLRATQDSEALKEPVQDVRSSNFKTHVVGTGQTKGRPPLQPKALATYNQQSEGVLSRSRKSF